jgi:hypothetical protein
VCREPCDDDLAHGPEVVGDGGHLVPGDSGVDEQHAGATAHDDRVALDEGALVNQNALGYLLQHFVSLSLSC